MANNDLVISIPLFIKKVMISKARRIKYYKKGGKIPKKYASYGFDSKGRLIDLSLIHI